jgi:hypothetical protein
MCSEQSVSCAPRLSDLHEPTASEGLRCWSRALRLSHHRAFTSGSERGDGHGVGIAVERYRRQSVRRRKVRPGYMFPSVYSKQNMERRMHVISGANCSMSYLDPSRSSRDRRAHTHIPVCGEACVR